MSLRQQKSATTHIVMEALNKYIPPDVREAARKDLTDALDNAEYLFIPIPPRDPQEAIDALREFERAAEIVGTKFGL